MTWRPLIALAEDNDELRELFAAGLERVGLDVVQAANGVDLIETVRKSRADHGRAVALIVADVRMPMLGGIAAVQRLRELGVDAPAIFMTAFGDAAVRREALSLDSTVIDKPLGLNGLRAAVAHTLGRADEPTPKP